MPEHSRKKLSGSSCCWLLAAPALLISACSSESEGRESFEPVTDVVAPLPLQEIEGDWQGLLSCAGRDFPSSLSVVGLDDGQLEVSWTLEPALGRRNYISPDGRTEISGRKLVGEYDPITGEAKMLEQIQQRPLRLNLLFGADTALLGYQRCDFGVLQRPPASNLEELQSELLLIQDPPSIRTEDQQGECPSELQEWIQAGLDLPLDNAGRGDTSGLWTDEVTTPIFGEPVLDFNAQQRIELRRALRGRCMVRGDRRQNAIVRALMAITDYRSFRDRRFIELAQPFAADWLEQRAQPLLESDPLPELSQASGLALSRIPENFNFERLFSGTELFDQDAYAQQVLAVNNTLMARQQEQDYLDNMRNTRFFHLLELQEAALVRDDIADAPAEAIVAELLVDKAEEHVRTARTAADAARMANWVSGVEAGLACGDATQKACADAAERFADRLEELADDFVAGETTTFESLSAQEPSLSNLSKLVSSRRELVRKYGRLLEYGDLPDLMEEYDELRFDWQQEQEDLLAQQLVTARTTSMLTAIDERYFAARDLVDRSENHLERLGKVYDDQLSGTRPFVDTGADAYLNALYNREFATLARMDAELLAGVTPMFRFLAQQINAVGELLGDAGRPFTSAARELENPSAVTAVALRYLLDYDDQYGSCLGDDAATVTFTERVDSVTRTSSGIELSRIRGVPVSTTYRIKREHLGLFEDVFSRPESPGADGLFEALFDLDGVNRLNDAVGEIMDEHRCDSEVVQGFERGLLAYYADRKRQWGR